MASPPTTTTDALTGAFVDRALEAEFRADHFEREVKRYTRVSVAVAAAFFLAYGAHDAFFLGPLRDEAWTIRYAIFVPITIAVLALAQSKAYARFHQAAMLAFGMATTGVVLWIGAIAPPVMFVLYTAYSIIFVTLGPFLAKMTVVTQCVYTLLTGALFLVLAITIAHPGLALGVSMEATILSLGAIGAIVARQDAMQAHEAFLQRRTIAVQMEELAVERAKSEALLLNILPSSIADRLKSSSGAIADGFPEVTVLFADIVGFTKLSSRLTPDALVQGLNEMFSMFDDLAGAHGVEKIKTIGDAYMAVGGLQGDGDHARTITDMALAMIERVGRFDRFGEPMSVRVGVHTGPAVAGVIGKTKFIYDVWGDTVNTASRMESHGAAGAVHVTAETRARLGDGYVLEARGVIDVKGKGPMETWFVRGKKAP